jgi:hypothetical protein
MVPLASVVESIEASVACLKSNFQHSESRKAVLKRYTRCGKLTSFFELSGLKEKGS